MWDNKKDKKNIKKRQVSFIEAIDSFFDPKGIQLIDEAHSENEKRYYWVGKTKSGRVLTTYFTIRVFF